LSPSEVIATSEVISDLSSVVCMCCSGAIVSDGRRQSLESEREIHVH
jgi:hypothetical protein